MKAETAPPEEAAVQLSSTVISSPSHLFDVVRPSARVIIQQAAAQLKMEATPECRASADTHPLLFRAFSTRPSGNAYATLSGTHTPARRTTGGAEGHPGSSGSLPAASVPSVALLQAATIHIAPLLHQLRHFRSIGTEADIRVVVDTVQHILPLLRVVLLYCLATAELAGASLTGRSHGTSGRDTPSLSLTSSSSPHPYGAGRGQSRGRAAAGVGYRGRGRQGSATDWLGDRMGPSAAAASHDNASEERLSEQLFSAAVEVITTLTDTEADWQKALSSVSTPKAEMERSLSVELHVTSLWLLSAVLLRFATAQINAGAYLPALFPDVDMRKKSSARHPLLYTLLWDTSPSVRVAAAAAVEALLHKLHSTIQYAEEPKPRRTASFTSLAVQCGSIIVALHEGLHWAIGSTGQSLCNDEVMVVPLLNAYAAVAAATPYHRCPHSLQVLLSSLRLPRLHQLLMHGTAEVYAAATHFVAQVLRNESLREETLTVLVEPSPCSPDEQEATAAKGTTSTALAAPSLLTALLSRAAYRVEVWRCLVPLARLSPRHLHAQFKPLMSASVQVVEGLQKLEEVESPATVAPTDSPKKQIAPSTHVDPARLPVSTTRASSAAFAECLRTWLHFMGYVWKSFDNNAEDPALHVERRDDRATVAQKALIHEELLRPAMRLRRCTEDVPVMTLRCLAQIGDAYVAAIPTPEWKEEMVTYVQTATANTNPRVRAEALTTLGMWLWQYPSLDDYVFAELESSMYVLTTDPDASARSKAAFALSNITARVAESLCPAVRNTVDAMATLCTAAMHATVMDVDEVVQGHGIRMMNHLLQVLTYEELISEVNGFDEGVAEGFLRVLLECLRATAPYQSTPCKARGGVGAPAPGASALLCKAKHRWNAACALGMGLSREVVFEAEPKIAVESVGALCDAVVRDRIFKVRTQSAAALGRIPGRCLGFLGGSKDMTPQVVRALCTALETATSTDNFMQYKEQATLLEVLRSSLSVMITSASPSTELADTFAEFRRLLEKEKLL